MRTSCVIAMVASLLLFTGCSTINSPGCGGGGGLQWGGFCSSGSCGTGGGGFNQGGGFGLGSSGFGGCDSGGCDSGGGGCASGNCGASASFSDVNCGPMCGAYLNEDQFGCSPGGGGGCGAEGCQVGQSFAKHSLGGLAQGLPRPSVSIPRPFANLSGKLAGLGGGGDASCGPCGESYASVGPTVSPCNNYGCGSPIGGGGGGAIGQAHSDISNATPGIVGAGEGAAVGRVGSRLSSLKYKFAGKQGSRHPYGGEPPHTASAAAGGQGGPAPTYAYPYYTTRGPRDFLQDGCGPPPIYPHNPRVGCLPSIGR